jgi:hypothetical protein
VTTTSGAIDGASNPPGTYSVSDSEDNLSTATTSIIGSSGPFSYAYTSAGTSSANSSYLNAGGGEAYEFLISSQTASTATVAVNASTATAVPGYSGAWVGFNCTPYSNICQNYIYSGYCGTGLICLYPDSWANQIFSIPTNTPITVYTSVTTQAGGPDECGTLALCIVPQLTWALANISSIDIDPAFLAIDPDAQIFFSPGVNQTGPSTLPTGGQP